jgi:hypothetical protein
MIQYFSVTENFPVLAIIGVLRETGSRSLRKNDPKNGLTDLLLQTRPHMGQEWSLKTTTSLGKKI